jgi:P pilus assembly protein, chaperone PapD
MLIMLRTRVKLFYRPEGLTAPGDITKSLQVSAVRDGRKGLGIQVKNTSAWFASLSNMTVETGGSKIPVNVDMVAPFSSETFWLNGKSAPQQGRGKVTLTAINDQGARISEHYDVTYP